MRWRMINAWRSGSEELCFQYQHDLDYYSIIFSIQQSGLFHLTLRLLKPEEDELPQLIFGFLVKIQPLFLFSILYKNAVLDNFGSHKSALLHAKNIPCKDRSEGFFLHSQTCK